MTMEWLFIDILHVQFHVFGVAAFFVGILVMRWTLSLIKTQQNKKTSNESWNSKDSNGTASLPRLAPWYFFGPLDFLPLFMNGDGLAGYLRERRKVLGRFTFRISCFEYLNISHQKSPYVVVSHVDDISKVYAQQRKLDLAVALPETVVLIHGKGGLQQLQGAKHFFHRKLFASLLTPRTLEGFTPQILTAFDRMWRELDATSAADSSTSLSIVLRDVVRKTQFFLMSKILYGIDGATPTSPERALAEQLQVNFELEDAALFASAGSSTFTEGLQASRQTRAILWQRFLMVLQRVKEESKVSQSTSSCNEEHKGQMVVGNAFQAIALALVESGKVNDPETLQEIQDNLLFLLEASHGTTMHITTSMLYFLNHPDNAECLDKIRTEVQQLLKSCNSPSVTDIKHSMPYGDACINETMRMAPIVGSVALHLPHGTSVTLPSDGTNLTGPLHLMLQSSNWYMDPNLFPQPTKFVPDRWLSATVKTGNINSNNTGMEVTAMAQKAFQPFGGGAHVCLGQSLARLVLKANLMCFAKHAGRSLAFDPTQTNIELGLFPEKAVSKGLPCRIVLHED
mmetsp:Transcript_27354/g.55965  ORF Transcript_27354/g.55965 Transcript_27354/m.55965 type:complete len:569 (-) Transcript_27354:210-1916(-)|eukprot:CAMPEP_0183306936 /NCGR_PEP_ID=MMETSP0160_2-20130417/15303_1 /TAXON_ID=2839 ORGANISM="Odontella Sinensis, Strain Grunow 1884" /NCGR_SAMPLE_ID=MMETSP0160_2 /ASSEMBLY_ACC=CAM_ASM_000250 /LENGTH=568 /DNA_ID=CAMNT_0025470417 /DNA_START=63 /DNA_END=1769 /DNA_ORIENTATION=-